MDPANRAVRLAASVCVWDMVIPTVLLSLYGRVQVLRTRTERASRYLKRAPLYQNLRHRYSLYLLATI